MMKSEKKRRISLCLGIISLMVGSVTIHPGPGSFFDFSIDQEILLLFVSVFFGILAIIIGYRSKFKIGVILGSINVLFFSVCFLGAFFNFGATFSKKVTCCSQMQAISSAVKMYCQKNERYLPDADAWCDQLLSFGNVEGLSIDSLLIKLGEDIDQDEKTSWFAFNKNLDGNRLSKIDHLTVLLFETEPGWNQNGTSDILASEGHPGFWPFSEGGYHFILIGPDSTFTVKFVKNSELDSLNWTVKNSPDDKNEDN